MSKEEAIFIDDKSRKFETSDLVLKVNPFMLLLVIPLIVPDDVEGLNILPFRITTSADLPKLRFADQLFNGNIGVLLWLNEENSGHWLGLIRKQHTIEIFDSYGFPFKNINKHLNSQMNISPDVLMLNAPKTPQAGRDLFNDLKSKYNVSIPTIDLTNTIEASLGAEVDKSIRDKEINSVATELRSTATTGRQIDKDIVDKYQKAINSAFTGSNNLDEVKSDVRKDLLDKNKYKLDKIPKNTMIKVFNKNVRVGTFISNLRASLKKTDTETDTQKKVSLILNYHLLMIE
eukprot:jgi/Bigna1/143221/aug1.77_g17929